MRWCAPCPVTSEEPHTGPGVLPLAPFLGPVLCRLTGAWGVCVPKAGAPPAHRSVPTTDFLEDSLPRMTVPSEPCCPPVRPGLLLLASGPVMGLAPGAASLRLSAPLCASLPLSAPLCASLPLSAPCSTHSPPSLQAVGLCAWVLDTVVWGSTCFSFFFWICKILLSKSWRTFTISNHQEKKD